jgi:hypothetical protein
MARKETVRGALIIRWEQQGRPNWNKEQTVRLCMQVDANFSGQGLTPAPRFRGAIARNDNHYIPTWVMGCHFPWLNPR